MTITEQRFSARKSRSVNIFPATGFLYFGTVSRSGGLQADLLAGMGGGALQETGKLHFARECMQSVE